MKNKLLYSISIFLFSMAGLYSQTKDYYYYKGQKIYLELDKTSVNISTDDNVQKSSITGLRIKDFNLEADKSNNVDQKIAKLDFEDALNETEFQQKIKLLKENPNVKNVSLYYKRDNARKIGTSNYFYVKLKNENDLKILQNIANQKDVQIVKQVPNMPQWYILSLKRSTNGNSLNLANYFYETGFFEDIDPAFMFDFKNNCTNDTNFGDLWGLNNVSNPNIDINACQAWNVSQGSGVKIAVVDQGIDKTHNDLSSNISPLSFDAQSGSSPSIFSGGSHGTHVAGTIAAVKDNNLQIVGVAPSSKILSVSHTLYGTPNIAAELASGISWAYQNGADVINNSWGDHGGIGYDLFHSAILENAILNAMTFGRDNKGCIVVFASGNYAPAMDYPAYFNDNILTVGSINSVGQRAASSGYGTKLDVVAPGVGILSTIPGNLTLPDSGTSMASPHAAGVCALILSVNPNLTGQQVRDIIEQTSQKVGSYTYGTVTGRTNGNWNIEMGYGLVDAYAAVIMAQCGTGSISGNDSICTNAPFTAPSGLSTYNWSVTQGSNLVTLSGNGTNSVVLTRTSQTLNGQVTLSLYYGNVSCGYRTISKTITVGSNFIVTSSGVGPSGQIDVFVSGGAPPYKVYRGENTLIYTSYTQGTFTVPFGCSGGILKVEADTSCGLTAVRKMYSGCSSSRLLVDESSNLKDSESANSAMYAVYPNPSSSILNITSTDDLKLPIEENSNAILYDLDGKEQRNLKLVESITSINVVGLKKGVYVLKIITNNKIENHKIIIE